MKTSALSDSKFLKKEDAGDGILVTIIDLKKENAGTDENPEEKWVLVFEECKPLVLNKTNTARIERALNSDETDDWIGKKIVLFNDENVEYKGEITGGVRVDMNRTKAYHAKKGGAPKPKPIEEMPDDLPWDESKDVPF
jgi:hypothetical protein